MMQDKCISIILPSFNDARIADAIASVRRFDDVGAVQLVVVDGGSSEEVRHIIETMLLPGDIYISEHDDGIFDALNKGLNLCEKKYIGWLGSDDVFTGQVKASDVIDALAKSDLLVAGSAICRGEEVRRVYYSLPSRFGLVKFGLHNPHFSTFGRSSLLKSEKFEIDILGSDIAYFIRIFNRKPRVASTAAIATVMNEGGFSTQSYRKVLRTNLELIAVYRKYTNWLVAPIAVLIKLAYKSWSLWYYKLFKLSRQSLVRTLCI